MSFASKLLNSPDTFPTKRKRYSRFVALEAQISNTSLSIVYRRFQYHSLRKKIDEFDDPQRNVMFRNLCIIFAQLRFKVKRSARSGNVQHPLRIGVYDRALVISREFVFALKKKDTRYVHDLDLEHGLVETIVRETDKSMVSISWEIFSALTMLPLIGNRYLVANCAQFRTPCTREPCFGGTGDKDATGGSTPLKRSLEKNVVRSVSTVLAVRARFLNRRPTRRWKRSLERDECRWTSQADSFSVRDHGVGEDFFPFAAIYYPKTVA